MTANSNKIENPSSSNSIMGILLGLIGVLIFSGTLPATRVAVGELDPWFITLARAMLASLLAVAVIGVLRKPLPRGAIFELLLAGLLLVYGFPGLMALGMLSVPSSHGGVVLGILPLATALFAVLLAGERPSSLFWICNVIGAVLIASYAIRDGEFGFAIGDLWLGLAGICASAGYVISGKLGRLFSGWEIICWALIFTLPVTFIGTIMTWDPALLSASREVQIAFLYLGLGSMFLGFFAWNAGLRIGGMARIGQLQLFQTFFTVAIGAWLLNEKVTLETWGFAAAILVVVAIGRKAQVR